MQGCFPASWQPDPERDATVSRGGPAARTVPAVRSLLAHRVWTCRDPILCPAMMKRGRSVLHPHGATGCVSVSRVRPSSGAAAAPRSAAGGHGDASTPSKGTAALHGAPQGRGCSGVIADHAPLGIPSLKLTGTATSVPMECPPMDAPILVSPHVHGCLVPFSLRGQQRGQSQVLPPGRRR